MRAPIVLSLLIASALAVAACSSSSGGGSTVCKNSAGSVIPCPDGGSSTGSDTKAGTDASASGGADATSAEDAGTGTDGGSTAPDVTNKTDTGSKKDTGASDKCAQSDTNCIQACMATQCGTEQGDCDTDKDCSNIISCVQACAKGDAKCQDACVSSAPKAAQELLTAWDKCIADKCIDMGGNGTGTCLQLNQCVAKCGATDAACQQACLGDASAEAIDQYNAAAKCVQASCSTECGGSDQQACSSCQQTKCKTELTACFGGGGGSPTGTGTCLELNQCIAKCGATDAACQQKCVQASSAEAVKAYDAASQCVQDKCAAECAGSDQQACVSCQQSKCKTEVAACLGGGGGTTPTGTGTCYGLLSCLQNCKDAACQQTCLKDTSEEGYKLYQAASQCGQAACAKDCTNPSAPACQTCLTTNCGKEIDACMADK